MTVAATRVLSFHATYRCRNSGECCTARWPIPFSGAQVRGCAGAQVPGALVPINEHGCVFHDAERHRCEIHASFGHDALPLACREFPRVTVLDPRGASITLSCFCPTALAMLDEAGGPISIVDQRSEIAGSPEGLDAVASLPPALRPDVLMDWESWWAFERLAVDQFNRDETPRDILARLSEIVENVRAWKPGEGELTARVHAAFAGTGVGGGVRDHSALHTPHAPAHLRFLACHAFANWTAHLGSGLRTWLRSLETVVFLLEEGWTIREIDEWLRHWADPRRLAAAWSSAEHDKGRS